MSLLRSPKQYTGVRPINPPNVIYADRSPASTDTAYVKGDLWEDLTHLTTWQYAGGGDWIALGTGATGGVVTLTGGSGGAISPVAGDIILAGTANQITTAGSGHTITWSLPSAITAPGSLTTTTSLTVGSGFTVSAGTSSVKALTAVGTALINASGAAVTTIGTGGTGAVNIGNATGNTAVTGSLTASTTLTATLGAITATNGDVVLGTAGNKLKSTSVASTTTAGANSFGKVSLSSGAAVVSTSSALTGSIIILTTQALGTVTAPTPIAVTARSNGVSFTITSSDATDTSSIGWMIIN